MVKIAGRVGIERNIQKQIMKFIQLSLLCQKVFLGSNLKENRDSKPIGIVVVVSKEDKHEDEAMNR